ncbi:nurim homolog isoform X1 [Centruroides sculpturatus]|uniref:nurim homolog isoform X1 n=1 Tax=Centruroides sculpturatus TaxID=218467 RepID=UPI000C6D9491|nr:nurim homolog isoform X1 [Centruroides sculpturatus]
MPLLISISKIIVALAALSITGLTFIRLISFLSQQRTFNELPLTNPYLALLIDGSCLVLFIIQHSFMKTSAVTNIIKKIGFETFQRTIYVVFTALTLQLLMIYWKSTTTLFLWKIDTLQNDLCWWTFTILHGIAWSFIYGGCLIMDLYEMIGIKQIYYDLRDLGNPRQCKSEHLLRLHDHCRHPSIICLIIILWIYPVMSLDRLMLAVILTVYALLGFQSDHLDYVYQKEQMHQKKIELEHYF